MKLTKAQKRALSTRQTDAFDADAVIGRANTLAALARKGLVSGSAPHARLTEAGKKVCGEMEGREQP